MIHKMTIFKEPLQHDLNCSARVGQNSIASKSTTRNAFLVLKCLIAVIVASQEN